MKARTHNPRRTFLGQSVTAVRLEAGLTQAQLATRMCTHQTVIAKWENGQLYPTLTTLEKLAEVTGKRLELRFV